MILLYLVHKTSVDQSSRFSSSVFYAPPWTNFALMDFQSWNYKLLLVQTFDFIFTDILHKSYNLYF